MTDAEIRIVQAHFARVYLAKGALSVLFYDRLFEIAPAARALFPKDMTAQREKLTDTLAFAVRHLGGGRDLEGALVELARRHVAYGARPEHFGPVGEALMHALREATPGGLTADQERAWAMTYATIEAAMVPAMIEAARSAAA